MLDKNGKQIVEGQYLQVIGCKTKGDNSVYIVNKQYDNGECCLYKVLQNGELSQTKYNIYFLDNRHDKEKQVTIIEKGQLKQAMQEVKAYINGITNNEVIHSFTRATEQKAEIGLIVHFTKRVLLVGHTNTICGQYEITNIYPNGRVCMHLLGKLGEKVADNANGYYQFLPIHLNFKAEVMQRLFDENYIEILERHTITKGEAKQQQQEQTEEIAQQAQEQPTETKTEAQEQTQIQEEQTTETATEQAEKPIKEEQEQQTDTTEQTETQKIENKITATYYPINEELAYSANYVNSFSEYTKGSATASYQNAINNLVTTAQEKADKYPDYFGEIQALVNRFNKLYAEWLNRYYHIESMCPSVMISGAGNFPTRKKEKQNTARDKHWQQYNYIKGIENDIINFSDRRRPIKSGDNDAIDKLKQKLEKLQQEREAIKEYNKKARAENKEQAPAYMLQNLGQNIRSVEERIKQLENAKQKPTEEKTEQYNSTVCKVVENTDIMRLQLIFEGVPSADIRSILKSNGFKWSPSNGAWQRQLTDNARYSTKKVIKQLEERKTA